VSCILRISGEQLDIDALIAQHNISPCNVWRKGEQRTYNKKIHTNSGASFITSDADFDEFETQLRDATTFLDLNTLAITSMTSMQGVQFATLDFGFSLYEDSIAQSCFFPIEFIRLLGKTGVALEVTHYACSK
jgi:hypothetical protein